MSNNNKIVNSNKIEKNNRQNVILKKDNKFITIQQHSIT